MFKCITYRQTNGNNIEKISRSFISERKCSSHKNPEYEKIYSRSINSPEEFWGEVAEEIFWYKKWDKVVDCSNPPFDRWFTGAETNTCYNAVDRHVENGRGDQSAIFYDSPYTKKKQKISYKELRDEVAKFAGVLSSLGVKKGDRVIIYLPMIPNAIISMLACTRIGAIHSVVFGGFASDQLAKRINHAEPSVVISASCGYGPKGPIDYKPLLDKALSISTHKVKHTIIFQREERRCEMKAGEIDWNEAMEKAKPVPCAKIKATDPLYILYTSGTTGTPKGIIRDTGGHLVSLKWSMKNIFGINPGDTFFAVSDIGWVVGHSYIVYGPLFHGVSTVLYEGKPVGTPDAGAVFRVCSEYDVKGFFTAPTSFRAIKREDPEGKLIKKYDLKKLKAIYLAGERSDPDTLQWAENIFHVPVIDNWWQTESGWPMASNFLGIGKTPFKIKHGSVTKPVPGWNLDVVDEEGKTCPPDTLGNIVAKLPLPPGSFPTLYKDPEKYKSVYFDKYPGYYLAGDAGFIDSDGYISIMTRTDDIINVSGIRLSTGTIEETLCCHPAVAEAAVIGPNDDFRGQVPVGFVVIKNGVEQPVEKIYEELIQLVREKIGPFAFFKKVVAIPLLPKTRSGKVLRVVMKNMANGLPPNPPGTIDDMDSLKHVEEALKSLGYPLQNK